MKLHEAVRAYLTIQTLSSRELDYKTAHALMITKKKLQPHVEFYSAEEMKLAEEFGEKDEKGNLVCREGGRFNFAGDGDEYVANRDEYITKKNALGEVTIEDFEPIKVPVPERITADQLEALFGIIDFGGIDVT